MQDFIERLRAKPEHVRKQIAIGTSGALTGVVALGWIVSMAAGGTLALKSSTPTDTNAPDFAALAEETQSEFNSLMGAAGAFTATSSEPALTVESNSRSTLDRNEQVDDTRTVIPF